MTTQTTSAIRDINELHSELEFAIKIAKKDRGPNWEVDASKVVALSNVDFHNQTNDAIAIRTIVLIKMAAKAGVKSAGNLKLSLTRWSKEAPIELDSKLKSEEEKTFAVKELKSLKAAWVLDYVVSKLDSCNSESLTKELIDWGLKNSGSLNDFIAAFNQHYSGRNADIVTVNIIFKTLLKNSLFDEKLSLLSPFEEIQRTVELIGDDSLKDKSNSKALSELQTLVAQYIDTITAVNPGFLVLASTANLVFRITTLSKSLAKTAEKKIMNINKRLLNNVYWLLPHLDEQNSKAILGSFELYKKCSLLFEKQFKSVFGQEFASYKISSDENSRSQNMHMLEEAILSFMPSWDSYMNKNENNPEVEQLDNKISRILKVVNIKFQDSKNDWVDFNPLKHELVDKLANPQAKVRVLTPGLVAVGQNAVERVLLKSVVSIG